MGAALKRALVTLASLHAQKLPQEVPGYSAGVAGSGTSDEFERPLGQLGGFTMDYAQLLPSRARYLSLDSQFIQHPD